MADEEEIPVRLDSQGQANGPTDEEQAAADAEQAEIVARIRKMKNVTEEAERKALQEKIDKANAGRNELIELVRSQEARIKVLEGKLP